MNLKHTGLKTHIIEMFSAIQNSEVVLVFVSLGTRLDLFAQWVEGSSQAGYTG